MPIDSAVILDNWICRPGYVEIRRGFTSQQTGTAPVETLMAYRGSPTGDKLFACSAGNIYNVTTRGSLTAPVSTGYTSNQWQSINFANPAGAWLLAFNGSDTPISYNGTTFANLVITGSSGSITLTPSKLFAAAVHQGRVLTIEQGTLHCWFAAAAAIQGAFQLLDLGSVFSKGGQLTAIGTWTWPGNVNVDSFVSFFTNQGQVAVYQGIDPSDASKWSLVGVFNIGQPLGPRALMQYGADLMIVTTDGIVPMSKVLAVDRAQDGDVSITGKIAGAFSAAVRAYSGNFGWQGIFYPGDTTSSNTNADGGGLGIFNIPTASLSTAMQFVQNMQTGAWSRFPSGINAICWELANNCIYFGASDGVYQWDYGSSDNGNTITYDLKSAWSAYGSPTNKQFTMIRPLLNTINIVAPALDIDVDYQESIPTAVPVIVPSTNTAAAIRYDWTGASGLGRVGAPRMQIVLAGDPTTGLLATGSGTDTLGVTSSIGLAISMGLPFDVTCQLIGFDLMYQNGGLL